MEAWRFKIELLRDFRPVVADSLNFDEVQYRIRITVKSRFRIRIKVTSWIQTSMKVLRFRKPDKRTSYLNVICSNDVQSGVQCPINNYKLLQNLKRYQFSLEELKYGFAATQVNSVLLAILIICTK
jgi:hypothetical protein